jgi:hypothetical protein
MDLPRSGRQTRVHAEDSHSMTDAIAEPGRGLTTAGPAPETLVEPITAAGLAALATAESLARQAMAANTLRAYLPWGLVGASTMIAYSRSTIYVTDRIVRSADSFQAIKVHAVWLSAQKKRAKGGSPDDDPRCGIGLVGHASMYCGQ